MSLEMKSKKSPLNIVLGAALIALSILMVNFFFGREELFFTNTRAGSFVGIAAACLVVFVIGVSRIFGHCYQKKKWEIILMKNSSFIVLLLFSAFSLSAQEFHKLITESEWKCEDNYTMGEAFKIKEVMHLSFSDGYYTQVGRIEVDRKEALSRASILQYESTHEYKVTNDGYVSRLESFTVSKLDDTIGFFDEQTINALSDTSTATSAKIEFLDVNRYRAIYDGNTEIVCKKKM